MAEKNPVKYAEETLGVHAIHEQARQQLDELEAARDSLVTLVGELRDLRDLIADREAAVTVDERGKTTDMSATAFEKHIRIALQQDPELVELRQRLRSKQGEHDRAETTASVLEKRIDVAVGRMAVLGGLLTFYAAVKTASAPGR